MSSGRTSGLGVVRRLGSDVVRAGRLLAAHGALTRRAPFWVVLRLEPPLDETRPMGAPWRRTRGPTLLEALRATERAAHDPQVAGVAVRLAGAPAGWAAAAALRRALDAVRAAGKPVVAYGERIGQPEYLVASGADRLWLPETGSLALVGLRSEGVYLKGLLDRLAIRADVVRVGDYKTAAESLARSAMSPESRAQVEAYLDDVFAVLVDAIARGRGLDPGAVRERIDAGPYGARRACEAGLADGCRYPDELEAALVELVPASADPSPRDDRPRARLVDAVAYDALRASDPGWRPLLRELPHVAYLAATGVIQRRGSLGGLSAEAWGRLLRRLRDDPVVRAVVLRITSPGGDALASDLLWRALRLVREQKPVVISMGEVAASGGYFAGVAGDVLLAEATTLTGSIGVVGGKLDASGLLARLGVASDGVERGARAGLATPTRGFTPDERAAVRREMEEIYDVFLRRVEEGRGLSRAALEPLAQGRIWSGRRALEARLVDALGGPLEAIAEARARAGIAAEERFVLDVYPHRLSAREALRGLSRLGVLE
ncbi:MAG TPA: signal peptide peptidase SppA [Myxococcota bacterium]